MEQLEVWLLEQALGWAFWVGRVSDDNVELVLVVVQKLEPVANVSLDLGVVEANGHAGEVLLGETDNSLEEGRN